MMKALTLYQPWASLISLGEKRIETRSWATSYRGPLLIHSAASIPRVAKEFCPEVARLLGVERYNGSSWYYMQHHCGDFTIGHILAICNLVDCVEITAKLFNSLSAQEISFGNYERGRYAWILEDIHQLSNPIPARGMQRIWNWDESEHEIAIDPYVIGDTKIWTPKGIRTGQQVDPGTEEAVLGLEVVG